jgi:hypothetical protein
MLRHNQAPREDTRDTGFRARIGEACSTLTQLRIASLGNPLDFGGKHLFYFPGDDERIFGNEAVALDDQVTCLEGEEEA